MAENWPKFDDRRFCTKSNSSTQCSGADLLSYIHIAVIGVVANYQPFLKSFINFRKCQKSVEVLNFRVFNCGHFGTYFIDKAGILVDKFKFEISQTKMDSDLSNTKF